MFSRNDPRIYKGEKMKQVKTSVSKNNKNISLKKPGLPTTPISIQTMKDYLSGVSTPYENRFVVTNAYDELKKEGMKQANKPESNIFREMTLREFDVGLLMVVALPEMHRTFALDMSKKLQNEFNCQTTSEKSLAELASLNYARILSIQFKIDSYLSKDSVTDIGVGYLKFASQELDRAERHYLTSLQTLKSMKQPPMQVNFKANTAVIGQNQVVQVKENENNKTK